MPKHIQVREPQDNREEARVRRLARSRLGPRDYILRARMVALSWDGVGVPAIAAALDCLPQDDPRGACAAAHRGRAEQSHLPGGYRPARPPGPSRRERPRGGGRAARGVLDARRAGIAVGRSQIRRICRTEGGALAAAPLVGDQRRPGVRPKRATVVTLYTTRRKAPRRCVDELGLVTPCTYAPVPG